MVAGGTILTTGAALVAEEGAILVVVDREGDSSLPLVVAVLSMLAPTHLTPAVFNQVTAKWLLATVRETRTHLGVA